MRSKKTAALVLSSAMLFTAMLGLAGCGGDKEDDKKPEPTPPGPTPGTTVTPKDPAEQGVTLRTDNRALAYVAYDKNGTELGKYTTLASAINAAVANDAEKGEGEEFGSYVRKVDGERNLFTNRAGFTSENDDMFWYYEDGNKLDQMFCWDSVESIQLLQNTNYIVHEVSKFGTKSLQSWNSYGLLDLNGNRISKETKSAQSWELSSTMDAGMIAFPKRLAGATKQVYNIDLSSVKITPPYQGGDPVYAFMGFYSWQDYYVVDLGIACDVTTGNWYPFEASSRDDSFSDAKYNIGDKCLMTSTWNSEGGYFTPDMTNISMSIETQLIEDPEDPEERYQSNLLVVKDKDGNVMYECRLEADVLANFFPGANMGKENTYVFNAGLDIVNGFATNDSVHVKNVDYFNGAKFENLTITEATAYFPTEEEMSDVDYGAGGIEAALRGNTYSIVLADNMKETPEEGVFDYVLLNNNLCSTYEAKDGKDVYSFSFDHVPVAQDEFGTNLKNYQDMIDSLKGTTLENVASKVDDINEVRDNIYLKAEELKKFHGLLDFTPFEEANELLLTVMELSDAAQAVVTDFKTLSDIDNYAIKGFTAPEGEEIAGYLYSEIEKFKTIKTAYDGLDADDQAKIAFHIEKAKFDTWATLATELPAAKAAAEAVTAKVKLGETNTTKVEEWTEHSATTALEELITWSMKMKVGTVWGKGENDDPNNAKVTLMNFDNNTYPSIRIVMCKEFLEANDVELPAYVQSILEAIKYDDFYEGAFYPIAGTIQAAMNIQNNTWLNNEEMQEFLNDVWAPDYVLSGQIAWNWNSGAKFETYYGSRTKYIADIAGGTLKDGDKAFKTYQYFDKVAAFLSDTLGFTIKGNGWGITEGTIELGGDESEAALAVVNKINALSVLDSAYEVKGWTAADGATDVKGYYYSEVLAYRATLEDLNALSTREKFAALGKINAENWAAWGKESDALAAIEASEKYTSAQSIIKLADTPTGTTYTDRNPEYALKQLTYWANRIARGTQWSGADNSDAPNANGVKVCNWDDNAYPSIRVALIANFLEKDLELTLTPYMKSMLTSIKSQAFYDDYVAIISGTAQLAKSITDNSKVKITDLSAEELAFVSKYFVANYNGALKSGFASFAQWQSGRAMNGIVNYVGAKIEGKDAIKNYFDVVTNFLTNIGYTADTGWGVKETVIKEKDIDKDVLQVVNLITAIGDISGNTINVKGWAAPAGSVITGYLGDELTAYRTFKTELAKLDATKQAAVKAEFTESMLTAWDTFDTEMAALQAEDALKNLSIKAVKVSGERQTFTGEEAMAELLAVLTTISRGELYVTNDDPNSGKVKTMTSDNQFMPSFFACFLVEKFNEAGVTLPSVIDSLLVQVAYKDKNGTPSVFVKDFKYIYNVASLAEKITNNTASKNEVVRVVNGYMKNFTKFQEGGFQWNFNASGGKDFANRSKAYVNYFGFGAKAAEGETPAVPAKTLAEIVKIVTDTLQDVTFTTYAGADTSITFEFGVTADITVANVKGDMPEGDPTPVDPEPAKPDHAIDVLENLLPETAWTDDEGATDGKTVTATKQDNGGWKFEAAEQLEGDWSYGYKQSYSDLKMTADDVICYDLTATGNNDILVYVMDTAAGDAKNQYVYLGGIIAEKNKVTGSLKGTITLQDMVDYLVRPKADGGRGDTSFENATELNIRMVRVYLNNGATLTLNELYIGRANNLLPETAWTVDEGATDGKTVTATKQDNGGWKFEAAEQLEGDWSYGYKQSYSDLKMTADDVIYYDLTATGNNDILVYVMDTAAGDAKNQYVYLGGIIAEKNKVTGSLKGTITLQDMVDYLVRPKADGGRGDTSFENATELNIRMVRVYLNNGATLTLNELYLGTKAE